MSTPRIYLDNAATSFPKPVEVYEAVDRYQRELGCAVGRGSSRAALEVQAIVDRCRLRAARFLGAARPEQVLFTFNGTDALNLALHGLLQPGDHVITSPWEHNSVVRPLHVWQQRGVTQHVLRPTLNGKIDLEELEQQLQQHRTKLVALSHASNVTGMIQPIAEAIQLAHAAGALVLLDGAQTAGHFPINLQELGADLFACPGHKGLLGPLGTGLLVLANGMEQRLQPVRQGGTGTHSELPEQPTDLPARFESGNHNAPGLVGLEAALAWLETKGLAALRQHEIEVTGDLLAGLCGLPNVDVILGEAVGPRVGVVSVQIPGIEPQLLATLLESHFHIETRAGLHCAPQAHAALGTLEHGGTVRFSPGFNTTAEEIAQAVDAIGQIAVAM